MTSHNFAIVLGPTLLWVTERSSLQLEQSSVENVIKVVADLIDSVHVIFPDRIDYAQRAEDNDLRAIVLEKRNEAIALYSVSSSGSSSNSGNTATTEQTDEGAVAKGTTSSGSQPSTPQLPPSSPGHRLSLQVPGQTAGAHTAIPRSLTADSPSPNHKRKASIRSMGRNFLGKINAPGVGSSSNHHHHHAASSKTPSPKDDHHGGAGVGTGRLDSDSGGGTS